MCGIFEKYIGKFSMCAIDDEKTSAIWIEINQRNCNQDKTDYGEKIEYSIPDQLDHLAAGLTRLNNALFAIPILLKKYSQDTLNTPNP